MGTIFYLVFCMIINIIILAYFYDHFNKLLIGMIYLCTVISITPFINIIAIGLIFYEMYKDKRSFEEMLSKFVSTRIIGKSNE